MWAAGGPELWLLIEDDQRVGIAGITQREYSELAELVTGRRFDGNTLDVGNADELLTILSLWEERHPGYDTEPDGLLSVRDLIEVLLKMPRAAPWRTRPRRTQ